MTLIKNVYFLYVFVAIFIIILVNNMWNTSVIFSEDRSASMQPYSFASHWISNNLEKDKIALLPSPGVFLATDPTLTNRVESYTEIWNSTHIILRANTTDSEVAKVRQELKNLIHNDTRIKYLAFDWVDPYATKLFVPKQCKAFDNKLIETKNFSFVTPHAQWKNRITLCEILDVSK